jgi:hypothetical protein
MTNEEIIEELYWSAHRAGVFQEFSLEVNNRLKLVRPENRIGVVEQVYREYRKDGLIPTGREVNYHQVSQ